MALSFGGDGEEARVARAQCVRRRIRGRGWEDLVVARSCRAWEDTFLKPRSPALGSRDQTVPTMMKAHGFPPTSRL